jgi:hypothetical protein
VAREKKKMAAWYDPRLLLATGIKSVISTLFGEFADKREAIAAANAIEPVPADGEFDYAATHSGGDFWFDYLADTGDGWNSTYAMARLAAIADLGPQLKQDTLPRGRLLILGGDQVYPTASAETYRDRFIAPYEEAYRRGGAPLWPDTKDERPHLYAIPGNHDWYDGLNAFFGLFCRRRVVRPEVDLGVDRPGKTIGGRQTQQTRSYFAIQLPGDWWVWGTDSQLEGYIDQPQIDYFQHAAAYWMKPGSKVILCVADPSWAYVDPKDPDKKFDSFSYLERLAGLALAPRRPEGEAEDAQRWPKEGEPMGHQLKLVLTGDSHHYCRWIDQGEDYPGLNYIVCGGGGAFLHPTHHLKAKTFKSRYPRPGIAGGPGEFSRQFNIASSENGEALFPSRGTSRKLAFGNLCFPLINKLFTATLTGLYLLFHWILDFTARALGWGTLDSVVGTGSYCHGVVRYWELILSSPWAVLLVLVAWLGYVNFAESPYSKSLKAFMGTAHAVAQAAVVTAVTVGAMQLLPNDGWWPIYAIPIAALVAGAFSAFTFGLYLLASLLLLGRHPNEGFSSMAIADYKSFLRLRIATDGRLEIYPIGLRKVPGDDGAQTTNPQLSPHLIEGPIVIS